jgi:hypothetical protein
MIRKRDPGYFGVHTFLSPPWKPPDVRAALRRVIDQVLGPVIISALLFFAVLSNFVIRGETKAIWALVAARI